MSPRTTSRRSRGLVTFSRSTLQTSLTSTELSHKYLTTKHRITCNWSSTGSQIPLKQPSRSVYSSASPNHPEQIARLTRKLKILRMKAPYPPGDPGFQESQTHLQEEKELTNLKSSQSNLHVPPKRPL